MMADHIRKEHGSMGYREIKLLKQSDKGTIYLVQEEAGEGRFVRKKLEGQHSVYSKLQSLSHPNLPKVYETALSEDFTIVVEEYIEGTPLGSTELSEKQFLCVVGELCGVLEYLHGRGIIHRDIKPSNLMMADDGHIRLIDFDAARMPKEEQEQDTHLLGTRGYAAPEQYGFAQTMKGRIFILSVLRWNGFWEKISEEGGTGRFFINAATWIPTKGISRSGKCGKLFFEKSKSGFMDVL